MGHSIGDAIIVTAIAAAIFGYYYLKSRERQRRLEVIHQERLAAMDKGIPLPELPIDPPPAPSKADYQVPLFLGITLTGLGGGLMITLWLAFAERVLWPFPLPFALMGVGFLIYSFLSDDRPGRDSPAKRGH
jgi:hypothetical protein